MPYTCLVKINRCENSVGSGTPVSEKVVQAFCLFFSGMHKSYIWHPIYPDLGCSALTALFLVSENAFSSA